LNGFYRFVIVCLSLSFLCCKRDGKGLEYDLIQLPIQSKVRCIEVFGDSLLFAGGDANGRGFVVVGDAQFSNFQLRAKSIKHEIYDAIQFQDRWYFGLDSVGLVSSDDLRKFSTYYWREPDWVSNLSKHPIRRFEAVGNDLFGIAGGKLAFGVVYQTPDSAESWNPQEYENELRALAVFGTELQWTAWVGGNGILLKKTNEEQTWKRIDFEKTFISDMLFQNESQGIFVTYKGDIHSSQDGGEHWILVEKSKKFRAVNRMIQSGDWMVIAANGGAFAYSKDAGKQWYWEQLDETLDLSDAFISGTNLVFTAEKGMLLKIDLNDLK
jgi:hypothetical protein